MKRAQRLRFPVVLVAAALAFAGPDTFADSGRNPPGDSHKPVHRGFGPGETLRFLMEWTVIDLAEITLGVCDDPREEGMWQIEMRLRSTGVVEAMGYTARDTVVTTVDSETLLPSRFRFHGYYGSRDSTRRRDSLYIFEQGRQILHEGGGAFPCSVKVHNLLSGMYWLRGKRPAVGDTITIPVFARSRQETRLTAVAMVARRREVVSTPVGRFPALVLEQLQPADERGRRRGPGMFIWITDDERRMPVRFQIGSGLRKLVVGLVAIGGPVE